MCGITGIISKKGINNELNSNFYESLLNIQHRGQDACGYVINNNNNTTIFKGNGLVKNTISYDKLSKIRGDIAIGHTRYPTTIAKDVSENQPFQTVSDIGFKLSIVHNGNLYDYQCVKYRLNNNGYNITSSSDSEVVLNYIRYKIEEQLIKQNVSLDSKYFMDFIQFGYDEFFDEIIINAVKDTINIFKGAFSIILLIDNYGLVCFRDQYGIRPLIYGESDNNILISSESISLDVLNYKNFKDVNEIFIFKKNNQIVKRNVDFNLTPCIFEYIYLARPETTINKVSVYEARMNMGYFLALNIKEKLSLDEINNIDCIIPVPDTSIISSSKLAIELKIPLKFAIIKNRYIDRTFIMKNQSERNNNIKRKLYIIKKEVENKNIIIMDDSIVRGNTCRHIIKELRLAGVNKIYLVSCSPQIKYKNLYGIDLPSNEELIAYNKTDEEIAKSIDADKVIYQKLEDLKNSITLINPNIQNFELSVFDGNYIS